MSDKATGPIVAQNKPVKVELDKDKDYYWCVCGRSKDQPFCDGSHKGTGFSPKAFKAEKDGEAWLCRCKHTANPPYCDGTHKQFDDDAVSKPGPGSKQKSDQPPKP